MFILVEGSDLLFFFIEGSDLGDLPRRVGGPGLGAGKAHQAGDKEQELPPPSHGRPSGCGQGGTR